ncbi:hypothetical protein AYI70_g11424 [Smittium culicis]|uniref:Uncharacterized protein n=1 Tax=Smittium culicis TaxID=133412 RepID=A0A1R1X1X3_9FUNG|nr:hypothetical protein AYI70_g11424 [Smittium culicis]
MDLRPHQGSDEGPDGHLGDRERPLTGNDEMTDLSSTGGRWTEKSAKKATGHWGNAYGHIPDRPAPVEHENRRPKIQKFLPLLQLVCA